MSDRPYMKTLALLYRLTVKTGLAAQGMRAMSDRSCMKTLAVYWAVLNCKSWRSLYLNVGLTSQTMSVSCDIKKHHNKI